VLIPVYLVPLWTILHMASLVKLRRAATQGRHSAITEHA
jgi:hypothetical protein